MLAAIVVTAGAGAMVVAPAQQAAAAPRAAGPTLPVEFDLSRYRPVAPETYRSLAFVDNGRSYLVAGRWLCQVGPTPGTVGCRGRSATAPPEVSGALISADQQGPWWISAGLLNQPTYRFGAPSGFRPRVLPVGRRVTISGVTCVAPRADVIACRTANHGLIFTRAWHKFFYPSADRAHSTNPAPRYLPARLRYWNQLPAAPQV